MGVFLTVLPWIGVLIVAVTGFMDTVSRQQRAENTLFKNRDQWEMYYRAGDSFGLSQAIYHFRYVKDGSAWRAYVISHPPWRGRNADPATVHLLSSPRGKYVCWNKPVKTLQGMVAISSTWADNIQKYIATGERFGG